MSRALVTPRGAVAPRRLLLALAVCICVLAAVRPGRAAEISVPPVPDTIAVPAGNRPFLMEHAVGTQNYLCLPRMNGTLGWSAIGPQATLFDDDMGQQLTHFLSVTPKDGVARPTWQHSRDSSTIWAAAVGDPAYVTPGAIPWLLLQVQDAQVGPHGGDRMTGTTFIHRVNTVGGSAPVADCPKVGARTFVAYAADYVFYRAAR